MQKGFIAISSVIIIAAVVLAISISVTYLAIGEGQSALATTKGEETLNLVESCIEEALMKIRSAPNYAGGTITFPTGSCSVTVIKQANNFTVTATNIGTDHIRTLETKATRTGSITITSWKEI